MTTKALEILIKECQDKCLVNQEPKYLCWLKKDEIKLCEYTGDSYSNGQGITFTKCLAYKEKIENGLLPKL